MTDCRLLWPRCRRAPARARRPRCGEVHHPHGIRSRRKEPRLAGLFPGRAFADPGGQEIGEESGIGRQWLKGPLEARLSAATDKQVIGAGPVTGAYSWVLRISLTDIRIVDEPPCEMRRQAGLTSGCRSASASRGARWW